MLKINVGTSNKMETLLIYVRNVFINNVNKFVNIRSLVGGHYGIVRHHERHKIYNYFQDY